MVVSSSLFDSFTYFKVECKDFSDHLPLICRINLSCPGQGIQNTNFNLNGNAWRKYKWKDNLKDQFIYSFTTLFAKLKTKISRANEPIVSFLPEFINIYIKTGKIWHVLIDNKSDVETNHNGGMQTASRRKQKSTHL